MQPLILYIDLFCGFGGTSAGLHAATLNGNPLAKVIACVNHDPKAIGSHELNYPEAKHFMEDLRLTNVYAIANILNYWRGVYPEALVGIWASLPCPHFSKARGSQPMEEEIRTMARSLYMKWDPVKEQHYPGDSYMQILKPDFVQIENVTEFMSWGPLDQNGKPISKKNGADFIDWCNHMRSFGYRDDWKELDSANYGAHTTRNRLFGMFAKPWVPITWPQPTHAKKPANAGMYGGLKKWKPVREVLDFEDEGESIFKRKKQLCDKTLAIIYNGAVKALKTGEHEFLFKYYGKGDNINSINTPAGTIRTKDTFAKVKLTQILQQYKTGYTVSVNEPLGAIATKPKAHLVSYILNTAHGGHTTTTEAPCPVIVARQDKAPLRLITVLMQENGIADIKMRMLRVDELLRIQGFPDTYKMLGTQTDHKKFIGNSVVPHVVKCWVEAIASRLLEAKKAA